MSYTPEQEQKWNRVIEALRESTPIQPFRLWIEPLRLITVTPTEVLAVNENKNVPLEMARHAETRVNAILHTEFGRGVGFRVVDAAEIEDSVRDTMLNPRYTFDNFVVGPFNSFAYNASLAVAEQPSEVYNPLFIYGDVGLGKTHLMNAIGNYILGQNPMARVMLTTSERFTNELIERIRSKQGSVMRNRMRSMDVLLVDDIQFLARTNVSQEEFFHTFNELFNAGKQIVLSSDRPPNEMPTIEERLRSRFGSGLIVDISKPDFETRVAILRRKAEDDGIDLPYDTAEFIAAHFDRSIRELEGALTRVSAQSKLMGYPISLELARSTLENLTQTQDTRVITPAIVIGVVAERFGIAKEDILSKKRSQEIVIPRQIAIYICRELTDLSTNQLGRAFGGRDHTTVMHSCEKVARQMKEDFSFRRRVEEMVSLVKNN